MSNKHETLTGLFTDIADAIRTKTGSTESIVADNFPEVIAAIDTQEDLDPELSDQDAKIAELQEAIASKVSATLTASDDGKGNVTITSSNLSFFIN